MRTSLEFFLGLLAQHGPTAVAREDFTGPHGAILRLLQRRGFLAREGGQHPVPSCPHCGEGTPYLLREQYVCNHCASTVDARHLQLWRLDLEAFLRWLARGLKLRGGVQSLDGRLWQLGTWKGNNLVSECFYWRCGPLAESGRTRLAAYRSVVILYGLSPLRIAETIHGFCISLLEILRWSRSLCVADRTELLQNRGTVRFDAHSGALWVGDRHLGEVPFGSKEFFFLRCIASRSLRGLRGPQVRSASTVEEPRQDGRGDVLSGPQEPHQEEVDSANRPADRDEEQGRGQSAPRVCRNVVVSPNRFSRRPNRSSGRLREMAAVDAT